MASLTTVVTRSFYKNPTKAVIVGVLIVLIVVSWRLFSTEPDLNAFRLIKVHTENSKSSKVAPVDLGSLAENNKPRKRLVNIPSEENGETAIEEFNDEVKEDTKEAHSKIRQQVQREKEEELRGDVAEMERAEKEMNQELGEASTKSPKALKTHGTKSQSGEILVKDFPIGRFNVLMTLVKVTPGGFLAQSLSKCLASICKHSSIDLTFHFIVDKGGSGVVRKIFRQMSGRCKTSRAVYHDVKELADKLRPLTQVLQKPFSSSPEGYYSDPIFFMSTALHQVFPKKLTRIIMLDIDLRFASDIKLLFRHFKRFKPSTIMGLAREQSPVYRHTFETYRKNNPGTLVGEPPPKGITGFNSGLVLLHLRNMRQSQVYNQILTGEAAIEITKRYQFQGHLGDQDFFSVLSIDYPELFYHLPCSWNRQLCTWWKDNGYANVFASYNKCSRSIHVYHGNCRSKIPIDGD